VTDRLVLAAGSMLDASAAVLVHAAHDAGFAGVGLRLSGDHAGSPELLDVALRASGIEIHDVEVHRISHDHDGGRDHAALMIERAVSVGAERMLVVSDLADDAATIHELTAIAGSCRDAGIELGVEYMAWTTPACPVAAIRIADASGCSIVVDLLHHVRVGAGTDELDAVAESGLLGWVQLCDAPIAPPDDLLHEARHGRLAPGDGELPLADLLAHVPSDAVISVEVQSDDLTSRLPPAERARYLAERARAVLSHRR
jgi:sugar phosphate isomerase/epimerase